MATVNTTVTAAWTKVADDTDDPVLITSGHPAVFEVALVATDTAPTVTGHRVEKMSDGEALTRLVLGYGFIFMRIADSRFDTATVVVSK